MGNDYRILKPISFNKSDKKDMELVDYVETLGVSFGTYVKLLIRRDMDGKLPITGEREDRVYSKKCISNLENKLDYIIGILNAREDIQITIKRKDN